MTSTLFHLDGSALSASDVSPHRAPAAASVRVHADAHLPSRAAESDDAPALLADTVTPPLRSFFLADAARAVDAAVAEVPDGAASQQHQQWHADMREVEAYLNALDSARADCASAGLFLRAESCMRRMEKAVRLLARRITGEANAVAERARVGLADQQRLQQLNLRKHWRSTVAAYEQNAAVVLAAAQQHHFAELEREDARARVALRDAETRPSPSQPWSSEVEHVQGVLQQHLRQRRYREAQKVHAQLSRLERQELKAQHRDATQHHVQMLSTIRARHEEELARMRAVHQQEKQEMWRAGRAELESMAHRHDVALQAVEERRLLLHERVQALLKAYTNADVLDPRATGLQLIRLSQTLWSPGEAPRSSTRTRQR
ncbi:hypothetical protein NESM_000037200 [Novymonas esmeraldas]|uniref:Uncharacterized protein n=1 Tax=Novymonas esmeraldas TaxID=1808958 RepID=A0AAW0F439_9TRYP